MTKRLSRAACAAMIAMAPLFAAQAGGMELTAQEEAGRAIYEEGRSAFADPFGGRIGMGFETVPGEAVRCANCHGPDGLGRPEGAVRPPGITWPELTRANGHAHEGGRRHPSFDEASVARAIVLGRDPAGNALDGTMPRFDISDRDLAALVAYLKKLEQRRDPGIDARTLRIGTLLPSAGRFAPAAQAVKATLQAYFERVNGQGGIHGRSLELVTGEYPGRAEAASALRDLVAQGDVFALLAPFAADVEGDLVAVASAAHIPVVGPLTLFGDDPRVVNPYVFHLLAGVGELAQVLALHAAGDAGRAVQPAVLLHPGDARGLAVSDAVQDQLAAQGWTRVTRVAFEPGAFDAAGIA
ncbi:MAG TPA: ABC transporter substrate-binding protein, partial [Usitatibacter sp.]|nr:ABC transporter substrate-binding protein [Usitatibacter sp.]